MLALSVQKAGAVSQTIIKICILVLLTVTGCKGMAAASPVSAIDSTLPTAAAELFSFSIIQVLVGFRFALTGNLQQFLGSIITGISLCGSCAVVRDHANKQVDERADAVVVAAGSAIAIVCNQSLLETQLLRKHLV